MHLVVKSDFDSSKVKGEELERQYSALVAQMTKHVPSKQDLVDAENDRSVPGSAHGPEFRISLESG